MGIGKGHHGVVGAVSKMAGARLVLYECRSELAGSKRVVMTPACRSRGMEAERWPPATAGISLSWQLRTTAECGCEPTAI